MSEPKPVEEMTFEEAMRELEQVVGQLERGDVPLENSIKLYERAGFQPTGRIGALPSPREHVTEHERSLPLF